jgi:hypothetical protein
LLGNTNGDAGDGKKVKDDISWVLRKEMTCSGSIILEKII